jgi:hypothetical protein
VLKVVLAEENAMRQNPFIVLALAAWPAAADQSTNQFLSAIPEGYYLQTYDDCGVAERQPHVSMKDCYLWTFAPSDTDAGPKERSAVFSYKGIQAVYTELDPKLSYVLALTYASDMSITASKASKPTASSCTDLTSCLKPRPHASSSTSPGKSPATAK